MGRMALFIVRFDSLCVPFQCAIENQSKDIFTITYIIRKELEQIMESKDLAAMHPYILDSYYADNAKKLRRMVNRILFKFRGLSNKDLDDFYSLANEVFTDVLKRYDGVQPFDGFLYACLSNRIMTEITRRNREKRKADRMCTSLDAVNGDDEESNLFNLIPSDFNTFDEAVKAQGNGQYQDDKVQMYIAKLSNRQVNILNLLVDGYKPIEIRQILEISPKEYSDDMETMRSYENVKVLF